MPTKKKQTPISAADFEKGLMLAGLLTPVTATEIEEREKLEMYEQMQHPPEIPSAKKQIKTRNLYFQRAVLAAEIVSSLHEESTFGRVKFQKLVYLCEYVASLNLQDRYLKKTAGPFDNKFMHSIIKEFQDQNWFTVEYVDQNGYTRAIYKPLPGCEKYKSYYTSYYKNSHTEIQRIIELFRKRKTDYTEISATLIACYLELKEIHPVITEENLLKKFYSWSEAKKRFEKTTVLQNWTWLQENGLVIVS